ncbi:hypothetical protein NP493_363g01001 [Ridgeia piscesae]|uniref:F-actin monooxygenase n=1 Tax=Ridgeia piscesae TaxID=27915 RepID=A0AAD9L402_RIDPI|nr:hypothetical protein NP493_363g01001 [Ridgeia piscesae]
MSRQQTSAPFGVPRGEGGVSHVPNLVDENSAASDIFDQFCTANTFQGIMGYFQQMCDLLGVRPEDHQIFYRKLKPRLVSWKAQSLWARLDRCATRREYKKGTACTNTRVLIIGAGPCGLRVAIEVAFLGGKAVIVEKRDRYSRNNVLHLWPYLIHDLKALGAKKFFGKFCASSIDHISIRTLQCILLKAALLVGVEIHPGVTFESILEPVAVEDTGWRVKVSPSDHPVSEFEFDVLLGADGKRNTLAGFRRKEFRGKLAIAVTANFINHNTQQEARVEEISGVAFIFNQKFFRELNQKTNVDLENIVYYKDETHYFVMTAKKHSLLIKGVILQDYDDPEQLLARNNVDQDALMAYAKEAAEVSTNHMLPDLEFAHNHYGQADVAMFDFTSMYHAEHASRVIERSGHKLLVALVGDSLLEPFWPMGTGCARGFLGAQDTAWMIRSWASGRQTPLEVMAERESIYQLLSQTTPENTCKNFSQYTIDPKTRYTNLNPHCVLPIQVKHQYDGGDLVYLNEIVQISEQNCKRYEWMRDQHYLLKWFQRQLEPYRSRIKVLDMTSSWRSGVALCALIHYYRPDLVDVYALCPNKVSENNQLAFDLAEREFGIKPMMTGEDMAMCDSPDLVTMVSYLSQFYEHFRKQVKVIKDKKPTESLQARLARMSKINSRIRQRKDEDDKEDKENQLGEGVYKRPIFTYGMAKKRIKEMNDENNGEGGDDVQAMDMEERKKRLGVRKDPTLRGLEAGMLGKNTVSVLAEDLAKKFRGEEPAAPEVKKLNPQPLTLGKAAPVDVCHFCGKKVYLVEKCMAEGVYFHRGCFRCHYCGTNLRLGAYTFQRGDGEEAMFFCFQHYGMTKPARRAKKRTYADNGGQCITMTMSVTARPDVLDGVGSTPERIEFDIESEQEESELEQTAHNLSGSIFGDESDSDSDERLSEGEVVELSGSSDDEQHWSDPEVSDGQMSWADLADTYRRQLRRSMRRRHSQQQQLGGTTDSDDTATIGSSCESWVSESETEKESEADDLKDPPRRKKMRKQEVKPESKFTLDPLSHSFGVDTKPSPTSVEMMRNRMSFFSAVSEPVRIDAHEFLGLAPPARAPATWSGSQEGETPEVQTGKVQGAVLTRLSGAVPPIAIVTSDDDESETEKVSLGARASELVDSDTTPTEPSVTLAEQENSELGDDFCQDDGTGDETGDEDEMEMKKCMERLLSEEMVDGGLDEACLESSDISDYDERHYLDDLVENNEGNLSDEMFETDLLVENADMIQGLSQTGAIVVDNVSGKDVSGNLEQTDALVVSNDGVIPALEQTDVLVSNNLKNASSELERTDVLVENNASGGEGGEIHLKITEGPLELDQTNTLVAINSDATNMSQLNQTDVLVANNLESSEAPHKQETQDSPVESSVDSKGVSPLERTDALVVNNLESTEVSLLEQTNALVESNSEETLGATNLSDLVACNIEQLSDDDSLLRPQVKHEPVSEVTTETAKVSQQQNQPDALVANILETTETPQKEETPNASVKSKVDSKDVSSLERTAALVESKVSSTEVSPLERADALAESTEVSSLEQTNALVASNLEDTLGATNLSELVACNVDQLSDDDSLLRPQTKHALVAEVPTSDDHGTLVCGESEDVLESDKAEVVPDITKTEVVDSSTEKSPSTVDQLTKDSPVVVDQPIEECPVVTETVDEPTEMDDESVGTASVEDTHTLSLLAAANADPLCDTGNLSDIVTLNAQQLMPDDSLLCDSEPGRKPVTRPEAIKPATDVTKPEVDVVKPEAGVTELKAVEVKESVESKGGKEQKEQVQCKAEAVVEPPAKDEEVVCPVKGQGNMGESADTEPSDEGKKSDITKADAGTVQNPVDTDTVKSAELKTDGASDTRQDADLTNDRQTDTTINAMVTDNLPDTMERSVDLSQLVTTNTGHLLADDSVFDLSVTSGETVTTPAVNGSSDGRVTPAVTSVTGDASDKSSIEANAIKRIDSLLENLSQTELAEFGRDSVSGQSAEPSLVEVSITDDEQGSHVVVVNETFINTSDRRRRKHMSSSSSTTDTKSASSVPSDHSKQPDSEDSLSLDKMVAANAGPCNGSMDEMLKQ